MRLLFLFLASCAGASPAAPPPVKSSSWALEAAVDRGDFPQTTSVLVVRDGKNVYERYWQSNPEVQNDTRSATKSIAALAVGIAVGQGKIASIDAPAFAFLADQRPFAHDGPAKAGITIADLLTMSSALDCNDDADESPGNEENMYPKKVWTRWAVDLPTRADYGRDGQGRGPFAYCTAGVFLLGQIVTRAVGRSVDDYLDDVLFGPLGITQGEWSKSPAGEVMTGGGLRLRTRDLAKIGQMVLDGGKWEGKQVVPADFVARALTKQRQAKPEQGYGMLFWQREYATTCGKSTGWFMSGNGGNVVLMVPDLHAVVVVTRVHYNSRGMHDETTKLLEQHILPTLPCAR